MKVFTTEITSDKIRSDNPIHQRLLMPYYLCMDYVQGDLLELGCGEGRGIEVIRALLNSYLGIDKIGSVVSRLGNTFRDCRFRQMHFPPLSGLADNSFNSIISFQVIEHIKNDRGFITEIFRVLRQGGVALLTTPNRRMSLTRNPWHVREYSADELMSLCGNVFSNVSIRGISGNEKVMKYYAANKSSVEKLTKFDVLNLQHRLPAFMLKFPYEIMNRINRNRLSTGNAGLVDEILYTDYLVTDNPDGSLDLLCILKK